MEFFDRKMEVIEFKLTRLGREKMRDGKFNPTYYSFADSNIIYDTKYFESGSNPSQNRTSEVIDLQNRMKLALVPSPSGLDKPFKPEFFNKSILGSSEIGNSNYPGFEIKLYSGHFSGSPQYKTSTFLNQNIPELTIELNYIWNTSSLYFNQEEYLLMEVNEINGVFEKENFEIKLYERRENIVLTSIPGRYDLDHILKYSPIDNNSSEQYEGNISSLLNIDSEEETGLSPEQVDYWFEIEFDEKIADIIDFERIEFENIYLRPENNITGSNC